MPRVEVCPDHDDFVLQLRIRPRQLGDDVIATRVMREITSLNVDPNLDRHAVFEKTNEVVVVLSRDHDRGDGVCPGVPRLEEDRTVLATAGLENGPDADLAK